MANVMTEVIKRLGGAAGPSIQMCPQPKQLQDGTPTKRKVQRKLNSDEPGAGQDDSDDEMECAALIEAEHLAPERRALARALLPLSDPHVLSHLTITCRTWQVIIDSLEGRLPYGEADARGSMDEGLEARGRYQGVDLEGRRLPAGGAPDPGRKTDEEAAGGGESGTGAQDGAAGAGLATAGGAGSRIGLGGGGRGAGGEEGGKGRAASTADCFPGRRLRIHAGA